MADGDFWNYRVVRVADGDEFVYEIHECHYSADQRNLRKPIPHSMTVNPVPVSSDSGRGIFNVIEMMQRSCSMPAIDSVTLQPVSKRMAVMEP